MKYVIQCVLILSLLFVGNLISEIIQHVIAIPGPIIGMIFLFLLLQFKVISLNQVNDVYTSIFGILTLFFLPSGISLMNYLDVIYTNFIPIISIGIGVTVIALAILMKVLDVTLNELARRKKHD